jgi:DNA repair photolyase
MRGIYEPAGRAREYAELACNLYTSCNHGCRYCYVNLIPGFACRNTTRAVPEPRKGILEQVGRDVRKKPGDPREILLCFTCDPYPARVETVVTREALLQLGYGKRKTTVLTKGGMRAARDFDILARNRWAFGQSIGLHTEAKLSFWEPRAASFQDRLGAFILAKDLGIRTWASIEPVIDAQEALECIEWCRRYVDFWKFGKTNHTNAIAEADPFWEEPDWKSYLTKALKIIGKTPHMVKVDLKKAVA